MKESLFRSSKHKITSNQQYFILWKERKLKHLKNIIQNRLRIERNLKMNSLINLKINSALTFIAQNKSPTSMTP